MLASLALLAFAWPAHAYDRIVVFGTSLSDPGNYFALTHVSITPPYGPTEVDPLLIPDGAYAIGGHHLSNGPTWIELLGRQMGLQVSVGAALANQGGASNYAVDGARAYEDGINFDLADQMTRFQNDFAGEAPPDALYVMEFGSNDVRDALQAGQPAGTQIIGQALNAIGTGLYTLYAMGARHFLIWNVPDLSKTPTAQILAEANPNIDVLQETQMATQGFNMALAGVVSSFVQQLPDADVKVLDAFDELDTIVSEPASFGLTDVTDACITPEVPPFQCSNPGGYLFWDGIHPTKAGHAIIAQEAAALLAQ